MAQPSAGPQRNEEEIPAAMQTSELKHSSYVLTLEEIGNLAAEGGKPAETLMNVVALIGKRFKTEVCSAYLLEPDRANLILAATVGLRPSCVGTLRMALNEGLAGLVAELVQPVAVEQVKNHPALQIFQRSGRGSIPVISRACRSSTVEFCRACWSCKRSMRAPLTTKRSRCSPRRRRSSLRWSARRARSIALSPRCRSASGLWRATCGGAGITIPRACSTIWTRCAGGSSITIQSRCSRKFLWLQ